MREVGGDTSVPHYQIRHGKYALISQHSYRGETSHLGQLAVCLGRALRPGQAGGASALAHDDLDGAQPRPRPLTTIPAWAVTVSASMR